MNTLWGWTCIDELAAEVYASMDREMLRGDFVFAYRGPGIGKILVTRRGADSWMLKVDYPGYSAYWPIVPKEFLLGQIATDMKEARLKKEIITSFIESVTNEQ